jgi:hypothetical protein
MSAAAAVLEPTRLPAITWPRNRSAAMFLEKLLNKQNLHLDNE